MAKKRPKQPKFVKNRSFSLISQRVALEINRSFSNQKLSIPRNKNKQQNNCSIRQMAASQNHI